MPTTPAWTPTARHSTGNGRPVPPSRLPALGPHEQQVIETWHRNMVRQLPPLDRAMGTILDAIRSRARDTLVVFLSDNGFMYGEHRLTSKNQPYEESIRVPMAVRYPAALPAAGHFVSAAMVSNVDIAPTIMDVAGIPWEADGLSLLPILSRQRPVVREGPLFEWCQVHDPDHPCQPEERAEELNVFQLPRYWGIETDRHVYIEYSTG